MPPNRINNEVVENRLCKKIFFIYLGIFFSVRLASKNRKTLNRYF